MAGFIADKGAGFDLPDLAAMARGTGLPHSPAFYLDHLHLPVRARGGRLLVVAGDGSPSNLLWLKAHYGKRARIVVARRKLLLAAIEKIFRATLLDEAVNALRRYEPQFSASRVVTRTQVRTALTICAVLGVAIFLMPRTTGMALVGLSAMMFGMNALFRAVLLWVGADERPDAPRNEPAIPDDALPSYSILVPLYREANVVAALARALDALDYPRRLLDIKLIVEADDADTARAAEALAAAPHICVIRVPPGSPRTKPRACNYALPFARGEFTVIFDAEDRPEIDQLRKAVAKFRSLPANVACLQARLNFYNADENWLTKMFALDYALWFDYLLPGLDRLNIPMPLGGTSNHFRTAALRAIHGWDPYNVTEDADLGIRLTRVGLHVRTLDSTTFEEATNSFGNWLKQRSRWLKGYMQTWLVHMRSPLTLLRTVGIGGFIGFQFFVGGTFLAAIFNPLLWAIFIASRLFGVHLPGLAFADVSARLSLAGLLAGNGLFAYLAMLAPFRRGWLELTPYGLTAPFYWLLVSLAGVRAFCQLFTKPWHWEKTAHGLSKTGAHA